MFSVPATPCPWVSALGALGALGGVTLQGHSLQGIRGSRFLKMLSGVHHWGVKILKYAMPATATLKTQTLCTFISNQH